MKSILKATRSKRTLRDSFNIFEPRALPYAIPQMIMCPTFGFGVFFAGLYGTTLGYTHAGLFYTISAVSMIIIRMISKHFMDTVPAIKTMTGAVACGILCCLMLLAAPYGNLSYGVRNLLWSRHWHKPAT